MLIYNELIRKFVGTIESQSKSNEFKLYVYKSVNTFIFISQKPSKYKGLGVGSNPCLSAKN